MFRGGLLGVLVLGMSSCVTELPSRVYQDQVAGSLVVGRVIMVLTGERSRRYAPQMRFLEWENQDLQKRFRVEINSSDQYFAVDMPPGTYRLTRVQISEGPFLSMADLAVEFSVDGSAVTHVGTWRFGVDSPGYGRRVLISLTADQKERGQTRVFLKEQYPNFSEIPMRETLPQPSQMEARLYEVMPYPRYSRYFRRHWW